MEPYEPSPVHVIHDLEALRAMADPLRTQIYEILIPAPASVRQVGERLGIAPGRLYYHINLLEKLGLVRVVETRMVANMVEKVYRAAAYSLDVAPELLDFNTDQGKESIRDVLTSSLDTTREDILRSLNARLFSLEQGAPERDRSMMVSRTTARIPDAYAAEFAGRLQALIAEFSARDQSSPGEGGGQGEAQNYALLVAFYPSFYYEEKT